VVTTGGDAIADAVVDAGAGVAVAPGDVDALADAIHQLFADPSTRASSAASSEALASRYRWSTTLSPIVEFCASPRRSPDLLAPGIAAEIGRGGDLSSPRARPVRTALGHVRSGEWTALWAKARLRLRRGQ